jgi:hypothetical protein
VFGPSGAPTLVTLLHHPSAVLSAQVLTMSWLALISLQSVNSIHSLQSKSTGEFDEKNMNKNKCFSFYNRHISNKIVPTF